MAVIWRFCGHVSGKQVTGVIVETYGFGRAVIVCNLRKGREAISNTEGVQVSSDIFI